MKRLSALALAALALGSLAASASAQYPAYGYYNPYPPYVPNPAHYGYQNYTTNNFYRPPYPTPNGPYSNFQARSYPNYQQPAYRTPTGAPYAPAPYQYRPSSYQGGQGGRLPASRNGGQTMPAARPNTTGHSQGADVVLIVPEDALAQDKNAFPQPLPKAGPEMLGPPTRDQQPLSPANGDQLPQGLGEPEGGYAGAGADSGCGGGGGGFFFLPGFTLMQPRWQNNAAFVTTTGAAAPFTFGQQDFTYNMTVSPNIYLGYTLPSGVGGRLHWWWFDQSADSLGAANAGLTINSAAPLGLSMAAGPLTAPATPTNRILANSELEVNVIDLEAINEWQTGRWNFLVGGGVRYARLSQRYDAWLMTDALANVQTLLSESRHEGVGPNIVAEVGHRLGDFGLGLYGITRTSVLFTRFSQNAIRFTPTAVLATADVAEQDVLPIADLEIGLDFAQSLGRLRLFARLGFLAQVWFGAGNSSNSNPVAIAPVGTTLIDPNPLSRNDLSFLGLCFTTGFQF